MTILTILPMLCNTPPMDMGNRLCNPLTMVLNLHLHDVTYRQTARKITVLFTVIWTVSIQIIQSHTNFPRIKIFLKNLKKIWGRFANIGTKWVKFGLSSIKCNNVFSNKIKPLRISANDDHHRKATKTRRTEHTHNTDGPLWRNTAITGTHTKILTNWNIVLI
jgi:hypothetical protein